MNKTISFDISEIVDYKIRKTVYNNIDISNRSKKQFSIWLSFEKLHSLASSLTVEPLGFPSSDPQSFLI
jgi:hypothetical protein